VLNVTNLEAFSTFLRLAAGRTSQVLNLSSLGADAGITHNTARSWLSVLDTGFIIHRLPAWHRKVKKQLTRSPKLHFLDSGLACHLLGIRSPAELRNHPLRGAIFESWVVSEVLKARAHQGLDLQLRYFRESRGLEVDLIIESVKRIVLTECKSGQTVASDFFKSLTRLTELLNEWGEKRPIQSRVVYGGDAAQTRTSGRVLPWNRVCEVDWG
jgi:predicted AAA+ superfamily ATPase